VPIDYAVGGGERLYNDPITPAGKRTTFFLPLMGEELLFWRQKRFLHISGGAINQHPAGFQTKLTFDVFPMALDRFLH